MLDESKEIVGLKIQVVIITNIEKNDIICLYKMEDVKYGRVAPMKDTFNDLRSILREDKD